MYLTWAVVLIGALLTATLEDWGRNAFRNGKIISPSDKMAAALHALRLLKEQHVKGGALSDKILNRELGTHVASVVMKALKKAGFVALSQDDKWVLARDLQNAQLNELYTVLGLDLENPSIGARASQALKEAEMARMKAMEKTLYDIMD